MDAIRKASTVLIGRDNQGALEILLLKRNTKLAFAGGLWVFPGGKVEDEELNAVKDELGAAKIAAVREAHEETNLKLDPNDLTFFSRWTTPTAEPKRFETYFFYASSKGKASKVTVDDSEIKEHLWISPEQALDRQSKGEIGMMPPTIMTLQLIRKCKTAKQVSDLLKKQPIVYTFPVLIRTKTGVTCLFEGDAGYESEDLNAPGARHRLTLSFSPLKTHFEFEGCAEDIEPVNGGMHV